MGEDCPPVILLWGEETAVGTLPSREEMGLRDVSCSPVGC